MRIVNKLPLTPKFLRVDPGFSGQVRNRPFLKQAAAYNFDNRFILKIGANEIKTIAVTFDGETDNSRTVTAMDMTPDASNIFILQDTKVKLFDDKWIELDLECDLSQSQIKVSSSDATAVCLIPIEGRKGKIVGIKYFNRELAKLYEFELDKKIIGAPTGFALNERHFFIGGGNEIDMFSIETGDRISSIRLSNEDSIVYNSGALMVSHTDMILFERHFDGRQLETGQNHVLPGHVPKKSFKVIKFVDQ